MMTDGVVTAKIIDRRDCWSIGIYEGPDPLTLRPVSGISQPVLSCSDVTDVTADFVADPFMIRKDDRWYMFFEVYNYDRQMGEIGMAWSDDALKWLYGQIVISEPWHLSYPYTFEWDGTYYMIPETLAPGTIRLYEASSFPEKWEYKKDLLEGEFADSSIIHYQGYWYLFACATPHAHDCLRLFTADTLGGDWSEHPMSPIINKNPASARPGGRVISYEGQLIRYAQDCSSEYGRSLRAFVITALGPKNYEEKAWRLDPILAPGGDGWRELRMHHADPHKIGGGQWIACVDAMKNIRK